MSARGIVGKGPQLKPRTHHCRQLEAALSRHRSQPAFWPWHLVVLLCSLCNNTSSLTPVTGWVEAYSPDRPAVLCAKPNGYSSKMRRAYSQEPFLKDMYLQLLQGLAVRPRQAFFFSLSWQSLAQDML